MILPSAVGNVGLTPGGPRRIDDGNRGDDGRGSRRDANGLPALRTLLGVIEKLVWRGSPFLVKGPFQDLTVVGRSGGSPPITLFCSHGRNAAAVLCSS